MKKVIMSAAIALFAVTAFAQSNDAKIKQERKKEYAKHKDTEGKTDRDKVDHNQYDVNNDGIFSPEEREARKTDKIARKEARKADRRDDGLLNGSTGQDNHGRDVSGTARGTTMEGREKGKAVSDVARSNGKGREKMHGGGMNRPDKAVHPSGGQRPTGAGRPSGGGRPMGAGHKNK